MTDIIEKGINWFNKQRGRFVTEPVTIITSGNSIPIRATVIEPESIINSQGLRVKTDKYVFLIDRSIIISLNIARGIRFTRLGDTYEAIIDRQSLDDFNDPRNTVVAIAAQRRKY